MDIIFIILAVILGFFVITFAIYWFNLDMKLIRVVYDWLQKHYDKMKRDKKPVSYTHLTLPTMAVV